MADIYTGQVRGGVVVFDEGTLPDGVRVRVEPIAEPDPLAPTRDWLLALATEAEADAPALPEDLAERHDHYAHGAPQS